MNDMNLFRMTIGLESWETAQRDCRELIEKNYDEIALHQDKVKLDVDWDRYEYFNARGELDAITVRDRGVMIGYNVFIYTRPIHYKSTLVANSDVIYLAPEYRNAKIGSDLIDFGEDVWMKKADMCVMHTKPEHPALRRLLELKGYILGEITLHKVRRE